MSGEVAEEWRQVCSVLRKKLGETTYRSWFKNLDLLQRDHDKIVLGAPSRFVRDWIHANYLPQILAAWHGIDLHILLIEVKVTKRASLSTRSQRSAAISAPTLKASAQPTLLPANRFQPVQPSLFPELVEEAVVTPPTDHDISDLPLFQSQGVTTAPPLQLAAPVVESLDQEPTHLSSLQATVQNHSSDADDDPIGAILSPLDERYTFQSFVTGPCNALAVAAAQQIVNGPSTVINPLVIYGGVGLGKTHLLQAIAWSLKERYPEQRVAYISAERFMYQFVKALKRKDTMGFKKAYRSINTLLIDDLQFIAGRDVTQQEFTQTFNALMDQNRQIIIAADRNPSEINAFDERLRSRLSGGLCVDLRPTTQEFRLEVLQKKVQHNDICVSHEVLSVIARQVPSNVRELEGALNRLSAHASLIGQRLDIDDVETILDGNVVNPAPKDMDIRSIQEYVADYYKVRVHDMLSNKRARSLARPRQVAMYLVKHLTTSSLPEIGKAFGGRDHTTVMYAVRKVEELKQKDQAFADDLKKLKRQLD